MKAEERDRRRRLAALRRVDDDCRRTIRRQAWPQGQLEREVLARQLAVADGHPSVYDQDADR